MSTKFKFGLGWQIFAAIVLGIIWGLVFKTQYNFISIINDVVLTLIQMCCIPYMITSLVCGFGGFDIRRGKKTLFTFICLVASVWLILFFICYFYYEIVYPGVHIHKFFSPNIPRHDGHLVKQFLTENPFFSLANSVIPSIVFFFSCLGIAIAAVPNKDRILKPMNAVLDGITKLILFTLNFLPLLVFTNVVLFFNDNIAYFKFSELIPYLVGVTFGNIFIILVIYPIIITCLTDITYREFLYEFKEVLVSSFITGSSMIVLPLIVQKIDKLSKKYNIKSRETDELKGSMVMISYNVKGALLTILMFIFFAAWFSGTDIKFRLVPQLFLCSVTSMFGGGTFGVIALLDLLELPHDIVSIYLASNNIFFVNNLLSAANSAFICLITLVVIFVCNNRIKLRLYSLIRGFLIIASILVIIFLTCKIYFSTIKTDNKYMSTIEKMVIKNQVNALFLNDISELKLPLDKQANDLTNIINRKVIIFGYKKDFPPFSFKNRQGQVIGYNIALANDLANLLNCKAVFIPYSSYSDACLSVKSGKIDIAFTESDRGMLNDLTNIDFSDPYLFLTYGLLVKDTIAGQFQSWRHIMDDDSLALCINKAFARNLQDDLKKLRDENRLNLLNGVSEFLNSQADDTAYILTAEEGAYLSIINPIYTVVIPEDLNLIQNRFLNMTIKAENATLKGFLNYFIKIKTGDKTFNALYKYWIEGKIE